MSNISQWSNSANGNTSASPNGFPEGMPPSGVNDAAREIMAAVRRQEEAAEWFDWGYTPTYATTTTFTLAGDRTTLFHVGRRLKLGDGSILYGTISDTTYSASTRISLNLDSGGLTSSLSSVSVGILALTNDSMPRGRFGELSATNTFTAPVTFSATASFSSKVAVGRDMNVSGTADFQSLVNFYRDVDFSGTANFQSAVNFSATVSFSSKVVFAAEVLVTRNSVQTISSAQTTSINWNIETYDTHGAHDTVTNNERITVPAGYTKADFLFYAIWAVNTTGTRLIKIVKDGTTDVGADERGAPGTLGYAAGNVSIMGIPVAGGDYFTADVYQSSGGNLNIAAQCSFYAKFYR